MRGVVGGRGLVGGWMDESNGNKANSDLFELGCGLSLKTFAFMVSTRFITSIKAFLSKLCN